MKVGSRLQRDLGLSPARPGQVRGWEVSRKREVGCRKSFILLDVKEARSRVWGKLDLRGQLDPDHGHLEHQARKWELCGGIRGHHKKGFECQ